MYNENLDSEPLEKKEENQQPAEIRKVRGLPAVPLYLAALLLVLGVVLGYGAGLLTIPVDCPEPVDCNIPQADEIGIILLYADDCPFCEKYNSFIDVLTGNAVPYRIEKEVAAGSGEGQQLIEEYEVGVLPALLIDAVSVPFNIPVQTTEGQTADLKKILRDYLVKDKYVMPEANLNTDKYYPTVRLGLDEFCADSEGVTTIMFFADPYDPFSIKEKVTIDSMQQKFGDNVRAQYYYIPSASPTLFSQYGRERVETAAQYFVCAQEQGKLKEMQDSFYGIYCDHTNDKEANTVELESCPVMNEHYGIPLDANEHEFVLGRVELDLNLFEGCLERAPLLLNDCEAMGQVFHVSSTPSVVIDCRYIIHPYNLEDNFCSLRPGLEGC